MSRTVDAGLRALIDSGHCKWFETVDMTLRDGVPLQLSTGEIVVGAGIYKSDLEEVEPLTMSLGEKVDDVVFKVTNVSKEIGLAVSGETNMLNGARGMLGIVFVNEYDLTEKYYDPKLPGEIVSGEVSQERVEFNLVSDLDVVVVSGRTVVSAFEWREPIHRVFGEEPNDLNPRGGGPLGPIDLTELGPRWRGRYPVLDPLMP